MGNLDFEQRLVDAFGDMLVYKSPDNGKFFSALSLPSFMRDWLVMRFSDKDGRIDKETISEYVKKTIPKKEQLKSFVKNKKTDEIKMSLS